MRHQVTNRDGAFWLATVTHGLAAILGQMLFNGIEQRKPALLHQNHDADAGDGLAHGHDLEDCIGAHGRPAFPILIAYRLEARQLAVTRHQCHKACGRSPIDKGLHTSGNSRQPLRVHARFGGIRSTRRHQGESGHGQ